MTDTVERSPLPMITDPVWTIIGKSLRTTV